MIVFSLTAREGRRRNTHRRARPEHGRCTRACRGMREYITGAVSAEAATDAPTESSRPSPISSSRRLTSTRVQRLEQQVMRMIVASTPEIQEGEAIGKHEQSRALESDLVRKRRFDPHGTHPSPREGAHSSSRYRHPRMGRTRTAAVLLLRATKARCAVGVSLRLTCRVRS